jgi:predicted nucleic-acid-binding Zn-ribbon protein
MNKKYTKEDLEPIVKKSFSYRQVLRNLNLKQAGGNYANIKAKIKLFDIDTSHFTGQLWSKGKTWTKIKDISFMLVEHSTYSTGIPISSSKIKIQLFKHGYKDYICEKCGNTEWLNNKIPLELHHINGNIFDNRIENLELLCPNCHSFTDTYRRSKKSAK